MANIRVSRADDKFMTGGVPEWLNGAVSKTVIHASVSGVRIPPPPQKN